MNLALDTCFGLFIAYLLFRVVDHYAMKYDIEELKSGVYIDESVQVFNKEEDQDEHINYRIWFLQVLVWCILVFISKIIVFVFEVSFYKPVVAIGEEFLSIFDGHPNIELFAVMIVIPVTLNSVQFWIQDNFLKGE